VHNTPCLFVEKTKKTLASRRGSSALRRARCCLQLLHACARLPNLLLKLRYLAGPTMTCAVSGRTGAVTQRHQQLVHAAQNKQCDVQAVLLPKRLLALAGYRWQCR